MHLYLVDSAVIIGLSENWLTVKSAADDSLVRDFPFDDVDGISVFGKPQFSTHLLCACIGRAVPVLFYSEDGRYFGHLSLSEHVDPERQKRQIYLSDDKDFCLAWSKRIVRAKLLNGLQMLQSLPDVYEFQERELHGLLHSLEYLHTAESVSQVLGFEGNGAKAYFSCLPKLLTNGDFSFRGRSARPPRDAFNSMLSFGYSIVHRNIVGAVNAAGLHPSFAFLHATKQGHAALASDLMEEWRAWLVDRVVLDLVNGGAVCRGDFYENDVGAVRMQVNAMRCLAHRLGDEMVRSEAYFFEGGDGRACGFQVALRRKVLMLAEAMEKGDPAAYQPFVWRRDMEARGHAEGS